MSNITMPPDVDAALLSPLVDQTADQWDSAQLSHYSASPSVSPPNSPVPAAKMLKMCTTPDSPSESEQRCFPTHQVFDFPEHSHLKQERLSVSIDPSIIAATKRSASPAPQVTKKSRTSAERINSRDFVPPDVSGLSKREARLVKNRAAAFLSRQRKREEFETMEIRVAELEQENARLLAITQNSPPDTHELACQVENLRTQLAAAEERERQLSAQLRAQLAARPTNTLIKVEEAADNEPTLSLSPRSSAPSPLKSGASLGLMVLLCALPTLLSMPMHATLPTSFAIPNPSLPATAPSFDFNSFLPSDYDWTHTGGNALMDLDDLHPAITSPSPPISQKLEFSTSGVSELDLEGGLGGLDISFDTAPSDNGKIRVRIHPSSSASSRETSPGPSDSDMSSYGMDSERTVEASFSPQPFSPSSLSTLSSPLSQLLYPPLPSPRGDPFFGVGASSDFLLPYSNEIADIFGSGDERGEHGSEHSYTSSEGARKRVRIALKSLPTSGGEGGEWEVQVC